MSDHDLLRELLPFLRDRNPQARQLALSNLLGHTPKDSPHRNVFFAGLRGGGLQGAQDNDVIRDLKILCRDQLATAHDAFRALVNLSDNSLVAASLSEKTFFNFLVSYTLHPQATLADLAAMILSNITSTPSTAAALLLLKVPILPDHSSSTGYYPVNSRSGTCTTPVPYPSDEPVEVLALPLLIEAFVQGAALDDERDPSKRQRKASLHFLASVFANTTIPPVGRDFFLTPRLSDPFEKEGILEYPLAKLIVFTEHKDTIRRGGVASVMKNCSFKREAHKAILSPDTEKVAISPSTVEAPGINMLPYLLLPLAGPEEFDLDAQELLPDALQFLPANKKREPDSVLRLTHVETLLLLCTTFWGREYLRAHGVYEVVRALHENETVEEVSEHIEKLVNYLKRAETDDTKNDVDTGGKALEDDEDEEDNLIVEV
ncbi:hypothetical protein BDY19DRAFT_895974 [Irpex rosettiformis]|uniref:Uncharacterized protein n=1 Tax=Irpex rosettiformis TaxID=378272 RepID=A0ACB8TV07_9APHY|nr:hypothetical protein BDY19DRAFT_895974 [Irpex rosettiformis]